MLSVKVDELLFATLAKKQCYQREGEKYKKSH